MFSRLGRFLHLRRRWVLAAAVLLTAVAGAFGPAVADAVKGGGFEDPSSESARAAQALEDGFGRGDADVVVLWRNADLEATEPAFAAQVGELVDGLPAEAVAQVLTPWSPELPEPARAGLVGSDGRTAMVVISLAGADESARAAAYDAIAADLVAPDPWETDLAGPIPAMTEMERTSERDIVRAELLAMPVLLVLLVLIFRSLTAALLPVTIGLVAILGAMGLLRLLTLVTDVSTFALNVTTILGLGLAIDYALFMVSRFREELDRHDGDVGAAVERTVSTAGRTIAYSGLTVLIAFAGMLFFPQMFLRSMGLGGMAVVLLDMVLALTLLPAILASLGTRVDAGRLPRGVAGRLPRRHRAPNPPASAAGGWARWAHAVLRRPGTVAVAATALLVVVALPALDLRAGVTDVRDLPASSVSRQAADRVSDQFPASAQVSLDVVVQGATDDDALAAFADALAALPGATGAGLVGAVPADGTDGRPATAHLRVTTDGVVDSAATGDLVRAVRAVDVPAGAEQVLVGGDAAVNLDSTDAITRTLPGTLGFVAGMTMLLLFLALGSVVLPVKAVLANVLSLGATMGMIVWGFGQGNLADLLGFSETGRVDPSNLVLIGLIAFGLAMDYELFLLSRVREAHLRGATPGAAIATGLERSGRTITSAALLLVVVLAAMTTSSLGFLQLIGLGLAFAVVVDATIVRALLVPAVMVLLGRASWWLPAPLARLHARIGMSEDDDASAAAPSAPGPSEPAHRVPAGTPS
ncbi:MMPL family transporter [Cellulomonas fimi]|uniref:MMPL family transporter n=1 Tax=Cellulomonas fimi TaxID=1708 RepID=A0A7Y0LVH1_CELFI|nr:MMPL family transporter [Cellulomonas fimi]NMR18986.1 MMPL family transporter [Cellulomonas fimi]